MGLWVQPLAWALPGIKWALDWVLPVEPPQLVRQPQPPRQGQAQQPVPLVALLLALEQGPLRVRPQVLGVPQSVPP